MGKKVKNTRSTSSGWIFLCICLFLFFVGALFFRATPAAALGTPPTIITYQAKLLNATNSPVTSATNMSFVLYDALTAGNVLYTAAGTIATPATMSITPSSGVFSVNLGDSSTNPLNTDIFKNNGSVYLEITVGAETLTPRKQITSAPFAINSAYLNGYGAATASTSAYIPLSDDQGNFQFKNTTNTGFTTLATTTIASSTITSLNSTTGNIVSLFANTASVASTFGVTGLSTLTGGFISSASSTVSGGFQVAGALNASSTFQAAGPTVLGNTLSVSSLSTLTGGLISSASSSVAQLQVSGALNASSTLLVNGAATLNSTLGVTGLTTLTNGLIANASSSFTGPVTVSGPLNASSTFFSRGDAYITTSTITNANITTLAVTSCTGCSSGSASLTANQTFTASNTFSVTTTFMGGVGVGTSTPAAKLAISGGAILAEGTFGGAGATPTDGAGTRLMWIPNKAAFRAGYVNGTQWDASNIGIYSAAFGENNTVSGDRAFGAGTGNTVSQTGSVAFGGSNSVSVTYSGAFGGSNTINSGGYGYAFGFGNTVSGASSAVALGTSNISSGGTGSAAIGSSNTAGGTAAIALGSSITVNGNRSVGIGLDTTTRTVSQNNAFVVIGGNAGFGTLAPGYTLSVTGTLGVSATSTFTTTTMASSTIVSLNATNAYISTLTVGTCTGCGSGGGASLTADQNFTGFNTFNATTTFTNNSAIMINTSTAFAQGRLLLDSQGNIYTSGTIRFAGDLLPQFSVVTSTAVSATATSTTSTLSSTGDTGKFPSAIVGGDGFPIVAYYSSSTHGLMVTHCTSTNCSTADSPVQVDGLDEDVGTFASMVLGADGFPSIVYYSVSSTNLRFAKCKNFGCTVAVTSTLDATAESGTYASMAIGVDGNPIVAFNRSNFLAVTHCLDPYCTNSVVKTTNGTTGKHIKIVIKGDGNPFMVYTLEANKVVYGNCSDTACATLSNFSDLSNAQTSKNGFSAVVVNRIGAPVVFYYSGSFTNDTRTRACTDATCTTLTSETTLLIPTNGTVFNMPEGPWFSAALAADGNPMFSYFVNNGTSVSPKIVHCNQKDCSDTSQQALPFGNSDGFTYTNGQSLIKSKDGVPMDFFYKSNTGDLMVWRGCANANSNGGCALNESVALSGSSLGSRGQYFYLIYSREIYAKQAYLSGFDLAESYLTDDTSLLPGDVVALDKRNPNRVVKADINDNAVAIGIVSTKPGLLLTEWGPDDPIFTSGTKMVSLALAGRVPLAVSSANGPIAVGDKLTASDVPGVAVRALAGQPSIGYAMENYFSAGVGSITAFVNLDSSGAAGTNAFQALTLDTANKKVVLGSSSTPYDLSLTGDLSMISTSLNTLSFSTTTLLTTQVADFENAKAFILNAQNFAPTSTPDRILFSLRSHNTPVFSVGANGDVNAAGNYYGQSATFGSSTNPGDLAERVDIAADDLVEAGDVMIVDPNSPDTYRRSGGAYDAAVAGVISSNPTIVVGKGKTDYTANLAMVGRVPVKVTNENGSIKRGDLLVASSQAGYAMKYDPTLDNSQKMVGVIGIALDPFSGTSGKIPALIRTGWAYSQNKNITSLQTSVEQIASIAGINLSTGQSELKVSAQNGKLGYQGGDLDLQGHVVVNVAAITAKDKKWSIDASGHFITHLTTSVGTQDMFAMQSPSSEFVFSSSTALVRGEARVIFDQGIQDIVDPTVPLKVTVTLTSAGSKGIYVAEKTTEGFVVKEIDGGTGTATFDWIVVARRREEQKNSPKPEIPATVSGENSSPTETSSTVEAPSVSSTENVISEAASSSIPVEETNPSVPTNP
jgi:hypothetical protein